jgi:N-acylneuraminate cytidylyltransferase
LKIAVIPARGGSKRIPRKNIKLFCGKPIIAWSIEVAIASDCFDKVLVSTDDPIIASIAKEYGAEVPFLRPKTLADDFIGTSDVVEHAINWAADNWTGLTNICCLYATAPFLSASDLRDSYQLLEKSNADYVFSATKYLYPIQRALRCRKDGLVEMIFPEHANTRSQDLEDLWHDAGQFYWGKVQAWLERKNIFLANSMPFVLPSYRVQDIDTLEDWHRAELAFIALNSSLNNTDYEPF